MTKSRSLPLNRSLPHLLLVYCGRKLPSWRLQGELAHKFTRGRNEQR